MVYIHVCMYAYYIMYSYYMYIHMCAACIAHYILYMETDVDFALLCVVIIFYLQILCVCAQMKDWYC